jgi:hypothetical protein
MARLYSRGEIEEEVKELQKVLQLMTDPDQRACKLCKTVYPPAELRGVRKCWCDYESPMFLDP